MADAGTLLDIYTVRLSMNRKGITTWPPGLREGVECFVEKLSRLDPKETVFVVIREGEPNRFILASSGEILWEHTLRSDHDTDVSAP